MATVYPHTGKAFVAGLISKLVSPPANYFIGWGTGAGTAAEGDSSLFTEETTDGRVVATLARLTTTVTNDTTQFVGTITASAARNITNAGVFDQNDPGGTLIVKADHATVPLVSGDSIEYDFRLRQTQG